ncbi:hypothetical protein [Bradyrhizobium sp. JYMT SZCCT0180]|uniref:hypothetical protein n=1 Tax=Bradyrhizobium sp. JYMT SZCCT0180 TaxID=2807666 RepID=UPI001BA9B802|nr:hypothetical protein [Bradyrhizobium sp. JYMT SZCCT0180]MBR1215994.1 hypothetical protein [Bradyrhizobium sp. JYMT SZCCT0180]
MVIHGMGGQPLFVAGERAHRSRYLPVLIAGGPGRHGARVPDKQPAQFVKLRHRVAFGFDGVIFHKLAGPSHLPDLPMWGDDTIMPRRNTDSLVKIAHIAK